jgi:hypothetical protein
MISKVKLRNFERGAVKVLGKRGSCDEGGNHMSKQRIWRSDFASLHRAQSPFAMVDL